MMFERLREDIQSVFHRDPAARNAFEVLTCYPGMHAIWIHRLSGMLVGHGLEVAGASGVELWPLADRD
jgi:serine O-acetyltransferase